jgi:hypothetical protein
MDRTGERSTANLVVDPNGSAPLKSYYIRIHAFESSAQRMRASDKTLRVFQVVSRNATVALMTHQIQPMLRLDDA